MIYIHYCNHCTKFHMLNGHKNACPICGSNMKEAQITFMDFVKLSEKERELYKLSITQNRAGI